MSKLGLHIISWNHSSQILDFIATAQPRLIVMLDFNDINVDVARASSPSTLFVGRQYVDSQPLDKPEVNARNFFTQLKPAIDKMSSRIDIWEGYNEIVINSPDDAQRYNDFTVAWADIMHSQGLKCAAYSFSVANPDLSFWPLLADGARACDYLALHEYDSPRMDTHAGDFCLHYRKAYAALPPDARRSILITECGIDDGQNQGWMQYATADDYLAQLAWYDGELMKDDYLVGASIFTLDGKDWRYFDVLQIVGRIADYIASHPTPPPSRPPTAPAITGIVLSPATLVSGQTLNVSITVTNNSTSTLPTQGPNPGFVYADGETYKTRGFPEVPNAFRVGVDFSGSTASGGIDHPYRWGLGSALRPGQSVTVTGGVRLATIQSRYYWAGLVQEQIAWLQDRVGRMLITVNSGQPPPGGPPPVITNVRFAPTTLNGGDLLNVSITVRNDSGATLPTQGPDPGFVYQEGETFASDGFPEASGAIRVGVDFDGRSGIDHPYRWGLGAPIAPGQTAVVNGAIRLNSAQSRKYWAGLVREQIAWLADNVGVQAITVNAGPPSPAAQVAITSVIFSPTTLEQGQLMQATVTVQNNSTSPLATQGPDPGFAYNEGDNFLTKQNPPIAGAYRVGIDFDGRTGIDHPYRWGLGATLAPGASAVVNGFVRLNRRQTTRFWVGLIQEQTGWLIDQQGATTVTVVHS